MRFASAFLLAAALLKAEVYLEPNRGQAANDAPFVARTSQGTLAAGSSGIQYKRHDGPGAAIVFEGASARVGGQANGQLSGVSHYVRGADSKQWVWDVPHYANVKFASVYRGVDLVYHAAHDEVEFDFELHPDADWRQIRLRVPDGTRIDEAGALDVGDLRIDAPRAWQLAAGKQIAIPVRFVRRGRRVSFQLGRYDRKLPLTIDPIVEFATFLGGSNNDEGIRVAEGSDGAIYLAGNTVSPDFPASLPTGDPLNRPETILNPTAFLSRLEPDGSKLDWSLFIGGPASQTVYDMKLDTLGNLYLLGGTTSATFPVTAGAWRSSIDPSGNDTFLVKLNAQTGHIEASTFLGIPNPSNRGTLMAIDIAGGVYIGGPGVAAAYFGSAPNGGPNSVTPSDFVLRLNSSITAPVYAYAWPYGSVTALAVDSSGELLVGGTVGDNGCSNCATPFPAVSPLPGVDQNPIFGTQAYLARLNPSGTTVNFASLLQGDGDSSGITDLKISSDGTVFVLGWSTGTKFPVVSPLTLEPYSVSVTLTPDDRTAAPFFTKLSSDIKSILQSTFFFSPQYVNPDSGLNMNLRLVLQSNGQPCLAGLNTPITQQTAGGLVGSSPNGYYGWSLSCVDSTGTKLNQITDLPAATYTDFASASDGGFLFTGSAENTFVTTPGVAQPNIGGSAAYSDYDATNAIPPGDAFLLRVSLNNPAPDIQGISPNYFVLDTANNSTCMPLLTGSGFAFGASITLNGKSVSGTMLDSGHMTLSFPCSAFEAGTNQIAMALPAPDGGSSSQPVTGLNAPPSFISVSPNSATTGAGETKVVIRATNLLPSSTLYWNGAARTASYVMDSAPATTGHFELILQPSELGQPATILVQVSNPGPGGGLSPKVQFTVQPASGVSAPVLFLPTVYAYSSSDPLGPALRIGGSGFTASTTAFWDGKEVPVSSFTATQISIQPPAGDLTHWGVHQVYAQNGSLQSLPVPVYIAHSVVASVSTYDPIQKRLYVLGSEQFPGGSTTDLLVFDAATGDLLNSISKVLSGSQAIAVSADGQFVYLGGVSGSNAQILRYNASSGALDLQWQIQPPAGATGTGVTSIVTPPDSPHTAIVSTTTGDVLIFDDSEARPNDSNEAGFFSTGIVNQGGYRVFFATATRIYATLEYGGPVTGNSACWIWLDYDALGITGGQPACSGPPPEVKEDNGVTYLTDGSRTFPISIPEEPSSVGYPSSLLALDLTSREAWQLSQTQVLQLTEYNMSAQQLELQAQLIPSNYPFGTSALFAAGNGSVLLVLPTGAVLIPAEVPMEQSSARPARARLRMK